MKITVLALLFLFIPAAGFSSTMLAQSGTPQIKREVENNLTHLSSKQARWNQLIGKWFGSLSLGGGGTYTWILDRNDDGTYQIQFRVIEPSGKKNDQIEVGEWGVSGDIYFTIFKGVLQDGEMEPADPFDPISRDAFRILKLTDEAIEYEHLDEGMRYTMRKVAPDFILP